MAEVKINIPADQLRQQCPSNSYTKPATPQKRESLKSVVTGGTSMQQDTLSARLKKTFLPGSFKDAAKYAVKNVLIPNAKVGLLAIAEMALFGQIRNSYNPSSYNRMWNNSNNRTNYSYQPMNSAPLSRIDRSTHNFKNIIFTTYDDCENVIGVLLEGIDRQGSVTVADFYELCGQPADWADVDWGWRSFKRLEPQAIRGGYIINIDPPVYLKGV